MSKPTRYPVGQARSGFAVQPHASANLSADSNNVSGWTSAALFIGTGGDLVVKMVDDEAYITFKNIPAGTFFPGIVKAVKNTTTCADIVAVAADIFYQKDV